MTGLITLATHAPTSVTHKRLVRFHIALAKQKTNKKTEPGTALITTATTFRAKTRNYSNSS